MRTKETLNHRLIQFVEYMIAGGAYFWVGYAAFFVFYSVFGWNLFASTMLSNLIGWTINFLLQRYWVFKNPKAKGHMGETTGRYIFITLINFGLNYLIIWGLQQVGISPYIGQFISSGFFTVWNYIWYKYWVFPLRYQKPTTKQRRAHR